MAGNSLYGRIEVIEKDLSGSVRLNAGSVGATVIKASKGSEVPVFIGTGQKSKILRLFGNPSASYPGVAEAIYYNSFRPLWISAPSLNGLYGGAFITKTGTIPFTNGLTTKEIADFSEVPNTETIGMGDNSTVLFKYTLSNKDYYINRSIDIKVDGVSITVSATDDDVEVLTTSPDVGSGTYTRATGELAFTFDSAIANAKSVEVTYNIDISEDCYFAIVDKNPQASDKYLKISMNSDKVFTMTAEVKERNNYLALPNSAYEFSLDSTYISPAGRRLYIDNILRDDDYFSYILNPSITVTTFTNDTDRVLMQGGSRGDDITITDLTRGWDYFKNKNTYPIDIFFDTTADAGVVSIFDSLRNNNQKYSHYILPLPLETNSATAISTKAGLSISNRGLSIYWNWGEILDNDSGTIFWTPLTGRVASKHALMDDYFNGLAPAWIDENNHGGLLGSGIRKMRWDIQDDSEAIALENGRVNAIVNDPVYGALIIHQRTTVIDETDFSYIGHSRLADFLLSNIVKQVLPFQITKLNDAEHRAIVSSKTDSILSAVTGTPFNLLREYRVICDDTNNTDEVLARKEFLLEVYVKFTPFSEKIRLVFTAVNQTVDIDELIGG